MAKNVKALRDDQLDEIIKTYNFEVMNFIDYQSFYNNLIQLKKEERISLDTYSNILSHLEPDGYVTAVYGDYNKVVLHSIESEFSVNSVAGTKIPITVKEMEDWIKDNCQKDLSEIHNANGLGDSLYEIKDGYTFTFLLNVKTEFLSLLKMLFENGEITEDIYNQMTGKETIKKYVSVSIKNYNRTVIHSVDETFSINFINLHCKRAFSPEIMDIWINNFIGKYSLIEVLNAKTVLEIMGLTIKVDGKNIVPIESIARQLERKSSKILNN